ncbi:MAG TPA: adenine phosphoribosyltransferase [Thermaerobacter sp.]
MTGATGERGPRAPVGVDEQFLRQHVRAVPDYPVQGVTFLDITPLLASAAAYRMAVEALCAAVRDIPFDLVLGIEARGFLLAAPLALELGKGFIPARKPGKLPLATARVDYRLEYGEAAIEIHQDGVAPGQRVLIVDDVLATGGTSAAAAALVERQGGTVAGFAYLIEIGFLEGRQRLGDRPVRVILRY